MSERPVVYNPDGTLYTGEPPVNASIPGTQPMALTGLDMQWIRAMVHEEVHAALKQHLNAGLDNLMADISEPVDEQEEMAAVLATMTGEEWETLVQRVKARKATE